MKCPYCQTENREDRDTCYYCSKDISMLRLLINRARYHYNNALEHAERQRWTEAAEELDNALELDASFTPARVVLGTVQAKMNHMDKAREIWRNAIIQDPSLEKALDYLNKMDAVLAERPLRKWLRRSVVVMCVLAIGLLVSGVFHLVTPASWTDLESASEAMLKGDYHVGMEQLDPLLKPGTALPVRRAAEAIEHLAGTQVAVALKRARERIAQGDLAGAEAQLATIRGMNLPPDSAREFTQLSADWDARAKSDLEALKDDLDVATDQMAGQAIARRIEAFANELPDRHALQLNVSQLRSEADKRLDSLPRRTASQEAAPNSVTSHLGDFVHALAMGDMTKAEASLVLALNASPEAERAEIAKAAEYASSGYAANGGPRESIASLTQGVRRHFAEVTFAPVIVEPQAVAISDEERASLEKWYDRWLSSVDRQAPDATTQSIARANVNDLTSPRREYATGALAWLAGDKDAAQSAADQLGRLGTDEATQMKNRLTDLLAAGSPQS